MSRQLIFSTVGAVVGWFAGGPAGSARGAQIGWLAGSTIASLTEPAQEVQGSRVGDLSVDASTYGATVPYVFGAARVAGNVIWASAKRETAHTRDVGGGGGKGGGGGATQTDYTYDMDIMFMLTSNEINNVSRVWWDGKLVWTTGAATPTDRWARMTVYTGGPDQLPDPTYEAAVGTANAPAYRGRGMVFIQGLQLPNATIPNLTFEVNAGQTAVVGETDNFMLSGTSGQKLLAVSNNNVVASTNEGGSSRFAVFNWEHNQIFRLHNTLPIIYQNDKRNLNPLLQSRYCPDADWGAARSMTCAADGGQISIHGYVGGVHKVFHYDTGYPTAEADMYYTILPNLPTSTTRVPIARLPGYGNIYVGLSGSDYNVSGNDYLVAYDTFSKGAGVVSWDYDFGGAGGITAVACYQSDYAGNTEVLAVAQGSNIKTFRHYFGWPVPGDFVYHLDVTLTISNAMTDIDAAAKPYWLAYSYDGTKLYGYWGGYVRVWNTTTGAVLYTYHFTDTAIFSTDCYSTADVFRVNPSSVYLTALATAGGSAATHDILVYDCDTGLLVTTIPSSKYSHDYNGGSPYPILNVHTGMLNGGVTSPNDVPQVPTAYTNCHATIGDDGVGWDATAQINGVSAYSCYNPVTDEVWALEDDAPYRIFRYRRADGALVGYYATDGQIRNTGWYYDGGNFEYNAVHNVITCSIGAYDPSPGVGWTRMFCYVFDATTGAFLRRFADLTLDDILDGQYATDPTTGYLWFSYNYLGHGFRVFNPATGAHVADHAVGSLPPSTTVYHPKFVGTDLIVFNGYKTLCVYTVSTGALQSYSMPEECYSFNYIAHTDSLWMHCMPNGPYDYPEGNVTAISQVGTTLTCTHTSTGAIPLQNNSYVKLNLGRTAGPRWRGTFSEYVGPVTVIDSTHFSVDIPSLEGTLDGSGYFQGGSMYVRQFHMSTRTLDSAILQTNSTGFGGGVMDRCFAWSEAIQKIVFSIVSFGGSYVTSAVTFDPATLAIESQAQYFSNYGTSITLSATGETWIVEGSTDLGRISWATSAGAPALLTVAEVVTALCVRAGMSPSEFDVSGIAGITRPVRGMAITQVDSTRASLEMLMASYFFGAVLRDKLYFVARGGSAVAALEYLDYIGDDPMVLERRSTTELPSQISLTYVSKEKDYSSMAQLSDALVTEQVSTANMQAPLVMNADEAKIVAEVMLTDAISSAIGTQLTIDISRTKLEPTDIVTASDANGNLFRFRITRREEIDGAIKLTLVRDDPTGLAQSGVTSATTGGQTEITVVVDTSFLILDLPLLRDADNSPGLYVALKAASPGSSWVQGEVYHSLNNTSFSSDVAIASQATMGLTTTALGAWSGGEVFDTTTSVTVDIGGGSLSSATYDQIVNDSTLNAAVIGNELVQYRTATLTGPGVYVLSGFLRGRRGTEAAAAAGTASGSRFLVLSGAGQRFLSLSNADLGAVRYYRAASVGQFVGDLTSTSIVPSGETLRPFSGVDPRANRDSTDTVITWKRRTRMATRLVGSLPISAPLGEASEAYEVEIWNSAFTVLKRTITSSTPSVTYTLAQQTADFGAGQTTLYVRIYQMSAAVGRGHVLQSTL